MNYLNRQSSVFVLLYKQTWKELIRNKLGLLLLFVIPTIFLAVVEWTTGTGVFSIKLHFYGQIRQITSNIREVSLIFIAAAICGFLMSYYAVLLFHKDFEYFRFFISMKLSPATFIYSRFCFFFSMVAVLGIYTTLLLRSMMSFSQIWSAFLGFLLLGAVYGAYGAIIGILTKDFMIAILFIALLANIDAGWLQNPVYYATAQQSEFIRLLPAFYPCQFILSAVFSKAINVWAAFMSCLYAALLFGFLFFIIHFKVKGLNHGKHNKEK